MAWIIDGVEGILVGINTEEIKSVMAVEQNAGKGKRRVEVILAYKDEIKREIFARETTAKLENVFEVLMNVIRAGKDVVITFDDIIERAELMSKRGEK